MKHYYFSQPLSLFVGIALTGCSVGAAPMSEAESAMYERFRADRQRCTEVSERAISYVDPKNGAAVAERSIKVEADVQRCMLSRGWNDPRHGGWKAGRF